MTLQPSLQPFKVLMHFITPQQKQAWARVCTTCRATFTRTAPAPLQRLEAILKLPHPIRAEGHGAREVRRSLPSLREGSGSDPDRRRPHVTFISVHGWTKKYYEEYCQYAAATFGLSVTILRYFNVYGLRQSLENIPWGSDHFYNRIMTGQPISLISMVPRCGICPRVRGGSGQHAGIGSRR